MLERMIRLGLFLLYLIIWFVVQSIFGTIIWDAETYQVILLTLLMTLAISVLFIEHFFTRPSDVMASSVAILLMMAPLGGLMRDLGMFYNFTIWYCLLMAGLSFSSLFLLNNQSPNNIANKISKSVKWITVNFGHARILFALPFLSIAAIYSKNAIEQWGMWFSLFALIALLPFDHIAKRLANLFISFKTKNESEILGEIVSVHADNIFRARRFKDANGSATLFEKVQYRFDHGGKTEFGEGFVIGTMVSEEEDTIKFVKTKIIEGNDLKDREIAILKGDTTLEENVAGIITSGTEISAVKFEYLPRTRLSEGDTLYFDTPFDERVFYQITNAVNLMEALDGKSENGRIVGHATQVGLYHSSSGAFEKYGWIPSMNSLLFKASPKSVKDVRDQDDSEILIGNMQGLELPLYLNAEELVTHHTAVLGVTGTGKSVFTRQLIKDVVEKGIKVVCIDFTNEHQAKLPSKGLSVRPVLDEKKKMTELAPIIDQWINEMDEFPNKRNKTNLAKWEREIMTMLGEAVKDFATSEDDVAILGLPDFTATSATMEFTKWFMKGLFKVAKEKKLLDSNGNKQIIAIVLEEAHTVIPEWNFGDQEKSTSAAINAISQVALQGRKYDVGFIVVAQRTASVSKTVLTQCNTIVAFKQFDKTSCDFLSNYFGSELANTLPNLRFKQAIVSGKALKGGTPIIFNVPEIIESDNSEGKSKGDPTQSARAVKEEDVPSVAAQVPYAEPFE